MIPSRFNIDYAKAFEEFTIQPHLQEQLVAWIERGVTPGVLLQGVLLGDLFVVFGMEDRSDQASVRGVVRFLAKYAPVQSRGGFHVLAWRARLELGPLTQAPEA